MARREQGGNVDARETAGATVVGKKHAAEVVLADTYVPAQRVQDRVAVTDWGEKNLRLQSLRCRSFGFRFARALTSPQTWYIRSARYKLSVCVSIVTVWVKPLPDRLGSHAIRLPLMRQTADCERSISLTRS